MGIGLATAAVAVFLVGCGTYETAEVTPMDETEPVPNCIAVEFFDADEWDGEAHNVRVATYCKKEID